MVKAESPLAKFCSSRTQHIQDHELSHLGGLVLEHVKSSDPFVLRARAYLYIQKFDTYRNSLNGEH